MNSEPSKHAARCLLTDLFGRDEIDHQPVTVADHHAFRESLAPRKPLDPIDELVAELRAAEFEGRGARP